MALRHRSPTTPPVRAATLARTRVRPRLAPSAAVLWPAYLLLALLLTLLLPHALAAGPRASGGAPLFGAFTYGGVWQGEAPIARLERTLGRHLEVVHWFVSWDTPFDPAWIATATRNGALPLITWQPMRPSLEAIASGRYDAAIRAFARGVRSVPGPVYLRPMPEMNGAWERWSGRPALYVQAWRHIVDLFRSSGVRNVRFVWSPNVTDVPATPENALERYYPGTAYVDVLALDGYNWGTARSGTTWRSFSDIFAEPYARITALGPQPVWITEVASAAQGGDKAAWIRAMLESCSTFPRIRALVWFNQDKETDWRLDDSAADVRALRLGLATTAQLASR